MPLLGDAHGLIHFQAVGPFAIVHFNQPRLPAPLHASRPAVALRCSCRRPPVIASHRPLACAIAHCALRSISSAGPTGKATFATTSSFDCCNAETIYSLCWLFAGGQRRFAGRCERRGPHVQIAELVAVERRSGHTSDAATRLVSQYARGAQRSG